MAQNLTNEQLASVKDCLAKGGKLSDVQKLLSDSFGLSMTYMDVRFLVDDLGLELVEQKAAAPAPEASKAPPPSAPRSDFVSLRTPEESAPDAAAQVEVEIDPVQRPGAVAGGKVKFTDGVSATWELDMEGRLRLGGAPENYRPSPTDISEFQIRLRELLGG